ncbi:MAG: hypothetical protein ACR2HH_08995 [Chthoniobacterales bacterium]
MKRISSLALGFLGLSLLAASPTPTPAPAAAPKACTGPEFRQFDFWLGKWTVRTPDGKQAGTSEITEVSGGCAIREQWQGGSGTPGTSLNYYDPATKQWHQDWVGGDGTILHLTGGLTGTAMVLSQETATASGQQINRITWTPSPDGKVQQHWETSDDGGKIWKTSFFGIYAH